MKHVLFANAGEKWYNTLMTIKKLKTTKPAVAPASSSAESAAPTGATIADRFKLDALDANATKGSVGKKAAAVALSVALLALAVTGVLTFVLYQHWDFLCNQVA